MYRGSRKHILDLLDSDGFVQTMNDLLAGAGVTLTSAHPRHPEGHANPEEWTLRQFCRAHQLDRLGFDSFDRWWVPDHYQNPRWDLLSLCDIEGETGLLIVEAKAHTSEIKDDGKPLGGDASPQAKLNHRHIGQCIAQAAQDLAKQFDGIGISRDTHYQLSNRVAHAWKLAECRMDVCLLYLGFTGDSGIADFAPPLVGDDHWRQVMQEHIIGVLPNDFIDRAIPIQGDRTMRMLVRSVPVLEVSPPAPQPHPKPDGE